MNSNNRRKPPQRPARPGLNRGRVQLAAQRTFVLADTISTADAAMFAYARMYLLRGRRLKPHDYRHLRRVLSLIAVPVGRGSGRGRPMQWALRYP